jgi:hypothetical protein
MRMAPPCHVRETIPALLANRYGLAYLRNSAARW